MRIRHVATVVSAALALAGLFAAACNPKAPSFAEADRAAIAAVITGQSEAWNRGDLAGFMAGYERSPELVFTSGATVRRGWDETMSKFRARYGDDVSSMGKLAFEVDEIRPLGADGAVVLGRWELTETVNAGRGVFSLAFERQRAGWRIVHDHTSAETSAE